MTPNPPTKICLDANILLELLFKRHRYQMVVDTLSEYQGVQFCISVLSVSIVMYFVEAEKQSKQLAQQFLDHYELLPMNQDDIAWAFDNDAGDYEDALQVACARRHGCRSFVTLDQKLASMYAAYLPVQTIC